MFKTQAPFADGESVSLSRWQLAYERMVVFLTAGGGLAMGFGVLVLSPRGLDVGDLVGWLALGVGVAASAALLLGHPQPVPFLIVIGVLVGGLAPFVDLALAMALNTILISILATAAVLLRTTKGFWSLVGLTVTSMAARPVMELMRIEGFQSVVIPATIPWTVAVVALIATAIGFRALRDQLIRREAHQREMDLLISSVAHSLRTPLTPVIGFAHLLEAEVIDEPAREYAHRIVSRGWELSESLDDLIIMARSGVDSLEILERPIDLKLAVEAVLPLVPGVTDKLRHCFVPGMVTGDPQRVRHLIRHLLSNAVIHGGPNLMVHSRVEPTTVSLYVKDDGVPLSAADRERIFESFYRRTGPEHSLGRGIGLTVSRTLARAMGGEVHLESDQSGNTVVLTLPADPSRAAPVTPNIGLDWRQQFADPI